jgi:ABC-type transport system substrate-binding protein
MGKKRQRLRLVGLALVVALLAAACGGGEEGGGEAPQAAPKQGGVLRTSLTDFGWVNGFDPTGEYLAFAWTIYGALSRSLLGTKHIANAPGNELFPDLAADMPEISSDGLTYTFKLKPGIKFGPPVNRDITSKDVAYAFQRINTAPLVAQYGFYYFGVVKGMDGKAKSADQKISGIETPDDQTIIFHLEKPTGDFLYRVFMPATAPIPEEVAKCFTKAGDYGRYVISSGPYMIQGSEKLDISSCKAMKPISGFDPSKEMILTRNPNYDQATDDLRSNYVDGMDITINTNVDDIFNKVQAGQLDSSIVEPPPKPVLQQYVTDPAKKPYLHSNSSDATSYIFLNVTTPPFDDINVRKAANWIMDKAAIQQAYGGTTLGDVATHIWPPIVLGDRLGQPRRRGQGQGGDEAVQVRHQQGRDLRRFPVQEPGDDQPQLQPVQRSRAGRGLEPAEDRHPGEAARVGHQRRLHHRPDRQEQHPDRDERPLGQGLRRPVHLRGAVHFGRDLRHREQQLRAGRADPAAGERVRRQAPERGADPERGRRHRRLSEGLQRPAGPAKRLLRQR